jgi:hypothetical protein
MALTFTKQKEGVVGDLRYWAGTITFDASYPTGGEAIVAGDFLFASTIFLLQLGTDDGVFCQFDRANSKIMVFFPTGGTAAAPTTVTTPSGAIASGTSAINAPGLNATAAITPGAGKEVGSTCDLSAVIVQVFALGQ